LDVCWQYQIRQNNREEDLIWSGVTEEEVSKLKVSDFKFEMIESPTKTRYKEIKDFIQKHEWLGKMSLTPTHFFTARYKGVLAGVVIMDMPTAFSKLVGENTRKLERLISRGACISWSPKNLASALIMWSIHQMVAKTPYRIFTAYSDPEAYELGTIYQSCNFIYLGQKYGTSKRYKLPDGQIVSDRYFRSRSAYKRYAKELGIVWEEHWNKGDSIFWGEMPEGVGDKIREYAKEFESKSEFVKTVKKHKYLYILGKNKKETKLLKRKFKELHPKLWGLPYPKERGK